MILGQTRILLNRTWFLRREFIFVRGKYEGQLMFMLRIKFLGLNLHVVRPVDCLRYGSDFITLKELVARSSD